MRQYAVHAVGRDLHHLLQRGAELAHPLCRCRGLADPDIKIVLCAEPFRGAEALSVRLGQVADLAPVACREHAVCLASLSLISLDVAASQI